MGKLSPASTSHLHVTRAEEILNKEAGWKALTGTTDFGTIAAAASSSSSSSSSSTSSHQLAFDIFVHQITALIGSYYVSLGGAVDALVFAGGVGEKSARLRSAVVQRVGCLGFEMDEERNQKLQPVSQTNNDNDSNDNNKDKDKDKKKHNGSDEDSGKVVRDVGRRRQDKDDDEKPGGGGGEKRVLVVETDEQFEMARSCAEKADLWTNE